MGRIPLVLLLVAGCATTAPVRMTSAGAPTMPGTRVALAQMPNYASVVVRGRDCRQRFGSGPRYDEHPPCRANAVAPTFTFAIPDVEDAAPHH